MTRIVFSSCFVESACQADPVTVLCVNRRNADFVFLALAQKVQFRSLFLRKL